MNETPSLQRQTARNRIYRYLYQAKEFCSRQTLSQDIGISMPTVYQNLSALMAEGLVAYSGEQQHTGGRRATGLRIVPEARIAIGISITENRLRITASDLHLQEIAYRKISYHVPLGQPGFAAMLAQELERFLDDNRLDRSRLLGVGITLPGLISPDETKVLLAPTLELKDVSLTELLALPYPVHIENDATSGGYAEWLIRGTPRNMAYLSLETGVGGALLIDGAPYSGDGRRSGEFGHICVEPGGLRCSCGKRGCLEAYCSARRISDDLGITLKEFFIRVENHMPEYEALWADLLRHLAIGINNIHMILDCDVVLGGFLTDFFPPYLPLLQQYVASGNTFEHNADFLHLSVLQRHTAALGASFHFIREFVETV